VLVVTASVLLDDDVEVLLELVLVRLLDFGQVDLGAGGDDTRNGPAKKKIFFF